MTHPNAAPSPLQPYDTVLLDVDGTLVDSNDAHAAAWSEAFTAHGRHHPPHTIRPLIGMGGDKLLQELAALDSESAEGKAIADTRTDIFKTRYLPMLSPTPGAAALVAWLLRSGLTIVVATSARREELDGLLDICDAAELADQATTSDDAERSKPDPDIISAALALVGASAGRAVLIGDTPYDVEAATRAGVATIAVRCGGWNDAALEGAAAIYDHPLQLLEALDRVGQPPQLVEFR
jgi:HAD superfamily hydrolase (TIGR01509 family)